MGECRCLKSQLNFRFHNPNTVEETANYIAKLFVEVNQTKVERVLQEVAEQLQAQNRGEMSHWE